ARIAIVWTIPGVIVWFLFVVLQWGVFFTSILAHVGGLAVALIVMRRIGMHRRVWIHAFIWYILVQLLSYLLTPAALNVNLAHHMQPGWEQTFHAYWQFLLTLNLLIAAMLWGLSELLGRIWPAKPMVIGELSRHSGEFA